MFDGTRDCTRPEDKQFNSWYDDLIWCPSQCYYYFKHESEMYCICLRWRHQNPWTAEIIKCENGDFYLITNTRQSYENHRQQEGLLRLPCRHSWC